MRHLMRWRPGDDWMYWKRSDRLVKDPYWLLVGNLLSRDFLRSLGWEEH
jgi:hypothetical protein